MLLKQCELAAAFQNGSSEGRKNGEEITDTFSQHN